MPFVESCPRQSVRRAAILTDGATRLVERYGRSWSDLLTILTTSGPSQLVQSTRIEEYRGKVFDDATAVLCSFM